MKAHFSFSHSYQRDVTLKIRVLQRTTQRWSLHLDTSKGGRYLHSPTQPRKGLVTVAYLNFSLNTFSPHLTLFERSLEDSKIKTFQFYYVSIYRRWPPEISPRKKANNPLETTRSETHRRLTSRTRICVLASSFPISSLF